MFHDLLTIIYQRLADISFGRHSRSMAVIFIVSEIILLFLTLETFPYDRHVSNDSKAEFSPADLCRNDFDVFSFLLLF